MKIVSRRGRSLGRRSDTDDLISRQLKSAAQCMADPLYFIERYIKIEDSVRALVPINLHDYQKEYVQTMHDEKAVCAVMCRQSGTTTVTLAYLLWNAIFRSDQLIMIGGASLGMTQHMCHIMQVMITEVPVWLRPNITHMSRTLVQFSNGSSIHMGVTSDGLFRGRSANIIYFDNFAISSAKIQADVMAYLYHTVSWGGKSIIASTPNGNSNMFAKVYHDALGGKNVFTPFKKTIHDLSQYDDKWKKMMRNAVGPAIWDQGYECNF